jgi:hypothetical protein
MCSCAQTKAAFLAILWRKLPFAPVLIAQAAIKNVANFGGNTSRPLPQLIDMAHTLALRERAGPWGNSLSFTKHQTALQQPCNHGVCMDELQGCCSDR